VLAAEAGQDIAVVPLFTESLGTDGSGAATYLDMMRTNSERIATALS
jgi:zinc/manganese transport system substrate-binding protein